jgi:hypothetical protein
MHREQQPNQAAYYLDTNASLHGFGKIERGNEIRADVRDQPRWLMLASITL